MHAPDQRKVMEFFAQYTPTQIQKGIVLVGPDETPSYAFYLVKGFVREYTISPEGNEFTLHMFAPYSYFPMMTVLADIPNRYYYEAATDAEVYRAPKKEVVTFLKENQDVLLDLTTRLLNGLDKVTMRIEQLVFRSARARLTSILLFLARHFGPTYIFTHRELASLAGVSRETVSRIMEQLKKKGVIKYHNQQIAIPDLEILEAELAED